MWQNSLQVEMDRSYSARKEWKYPVLNFWDILAILGYLDLQTLPKIRGSDALELNVERKTVEKVNGLQETL